MNRIKKIGFIAVLAATLMALTSCSKESLLEDSWKVIDCRVDGEYAPGMYGSIWTFNDGGTCICNFASAILTGNWTLNNNQLTIIFTGGYASKDYLGRMDVTIKELNSSRLEIFGTFWEDDDPELISMTFSK